MAGRSQQPFPDLTSSVLTPEGRLTPLWQRLFLALWQKLGAGQSQTAFAVYLERDSTTGAVYAYNSADGTVIGQVTLGDTVGGPAQAVAIGSVSPYTYVATVAGVLVVFGAHIDVSRDNGATWYRVTEMGGQVVLQKRDRARLTWYGDPPQTTFFPSV